MSMLMFSQEELDTLASQIASHVLGHLGELAQAPRYMDMEEAAEYMSLPVGQLRKLVQAKKIPHLRPTRRIIFDREDIDVWMRRHPVNGRADAS